MPEEELNKDPIGARRGKSYFDRVKEYSLAAKEHVQNAYYTPPYQPTNAHWEKTFSALGWNRDTIEKFWVVFCRINKSLSGEITILEFLNYFNMDRVPYVEKCFSYFDTTGGDDIDFLEFMVSVWNICTLNVETLTNFTFDIYDLDSDGELSFPEIERMVREFFGKEGVESGLGKECLRDVTQFAEERGGVLTLTSFTIFTMNHSMLLFPIFQIQRVIQTKVMGLRYWEELERSRSENPVSSQKHVFDPRHVQILLRSYQTGGAAAILTHTGDPNKGLREWFEKQNNSSQEEDNLDTETNLARRRWRVLRKNFFEGNRLNEILEKIRRISDYEKKNEKKSSKESSKDAVDTLASTKKEKGRPTDMAVAKSGPRIHHSNYGFKRREQSMTDPSARKQNGQHGKENIRNTVMTNMAVAAQGERVRHSNFGFKRHSTGAEGTENKVSFEEKVKMDGVDVQETQSNIETEKVAEEEKQKTQNKSDNKLETVDDKLTPSKATQPETDEEKRRRQKRNKRIKKKQSSIRKSGGKGKVESKGNDQANTRPRTPGAVVYNNSSILKKRSVKEKSDWLTKNNKDKK